VTAHVIAVQQIEDLLGIVRRLEAKGVALVVLSMGGQRVDTRTATGKLMLAMLAAVAAFERDLMLERQREGIAKAKAEGKYKGRAPTARRQAAEVTKMRAEGVRPADIARTLGIGRASVYRILGAAEGRRGAECPRGSFIKTFTGFLFL
jgi:DNA invertase Pin-like site-specific DNA recombinase